MFDVTNNNVAYVIFSIVPERMGDVTQKLYGLPHKYIIGFWGGQFEASVIVPRDVFDKHRDYFMVGQDSFLALQMPKPNGARPATLVSRFGKQAWELPNSWTSKYIGDLVQVNGPPADGAAYSFDPTTGFYFATIEKER